MTLQEQYTLLIRLKCCSANMADKISTYLQYGSCDNTNNLILLNGSIELIQDYNVENIDINCLTEEEFDNVVIMATNICNLCNCN